MQCTFSPFLFLKRPPFLPGAEADALLAVAVLLLLVVVSAGFLAEDCCLLLEAGGNSASLDTRARALTGLLASAPMHSNSGSDSSYLRFSFCVAAVTVPAAASGYSSSESAFLFFALAPFLPFLVAGATGAGEAGAD